MFSLPFEMSLALRYLKPKRTFVSIITLISIAGVMLGVAVLIIVTAVMSGFDEEWQNRILGFNAHAKVMHMDRSPVPNYEALGERIEKEEGVIGTAPFIFDQVFVETQPDPDDPVRKPEVAAPILRGIDPEKEPSVSNLKDSIIAGEFAVDDYGVLVGSELAYQLDLRIGDRMAIYSRKDLNEMRKKRDGDEEVAILPEDFEVTGIFDVKFADYNSTVIFTSLDHARDMAGWDEGAHGIMVKMDEPFLARQLEQSLQGQLGPEFRILTWMQEYEQIFSALVVEKNMIRFLLFFIVLVAAFGITSSQITFVVQKTREIGILRSLGAKTGQIVLIFLSQCMVVGVIGVGCGFVLGRLALKYRQDFLSLLNKVTGSDLLPPSIYKLYDLPAKILTSDLIVICGVSLGICIVAGVIPALVAANLKPVEALRHE